MRPAVVALALVVVARPLAAQPVGEVEVTVARPQLPPVEHGYRTVRVALVSRSSRPREVTLSIPSFGYPRSGADLREVRRTVRLGPLERASVTIPVPALALMGSGLKVTAAGQETVLPLAIDNPSSVAARGGGPDDPDELVVLASRSVSGEALEKGGHLLPTQVHRWEQPLAEWDTVWQAYSSYEGVFLTAADLAGLPEAARAALEQYAESGGTLVVLGETAAAPRVRYAGFGQVYTFTSSDPGALGAGTWIELRESFWRSYAPWRVRWNAENAHQSFPVVNAIGIPVRGLFLLILVFAVAIGPLNLWAWARAKRKLLLLVTVPALSIFTSVAVYLYALLSEGVARHARVEVLTLLEEGAHRATTFGLAAYYSALTPGGGLRFAPETELTLQGASTEGIPLSLDWTEGQHLSSGWMRARVPAYFQLRKSELRRERVSFAREAGGLWAVNGLGADVDSLWYADGEGKVWKGENVAAGKRTLLEASGQRAEGNERTLRDLYRGDWLGLTGRLLYGAPAALRPNCYLAVLRTTPFLEDALPRVGKRKGLSVVYGVRGG